MNLSENQIRKGSKKVVGRIGTNPVIELATKGGLHLVIAARKGTFETLGAGSHRAIARHIARKKEPEIAWEMSKADYFSLEELGLAAELPQFEALTDAMRAAQGL